MKYFEELAEKFGIIKQAEKLTEECHELEDAIVDNDSRMTVLHEFADVFIVMKSIKYHYNFTNEDIAKAILIKSEKAKGYL